VPGFIDLDQDNIMLGIGTVPMQITHPTTAISVFTFKVIIF
jgi:hypothetical protein